MHADTKWYKLLTSKKPNYFEVTRAYNEHFQANEFVKSTQTKQYKNWLKALGTNFDADGNLLEPESSADDVAILNAAAATATVTVQADVTEDAGAAAPSWSCIGPKKVDWSIPMDLSSWGGNTTTQGVVRSIAQHATKIFVGTMSAGIWRSTDDGNKWECVTKTLLVAQVKGIAICHDHPDTMYAATGSGPLKSTDGGSNWSFTADNNLDFTTLYPYCPDPANIIVHPSKPDVALFAAKKPYSDYKDVLSGGPSQQARKTAMDDKVGIWRTEDGGANWSRPATLSNLEAWDVAFHPTKPDTVYACMKNGNQAEFHRSTDNGKTWTKITKTYPTENNHAYLTTQGSWRIHNQPSQQSGNPATNAFDGDSSTIWHTQYHPAIDVPQGQRELQIDLVDSYAMSGFSYLPRQDGDLNGIIGDFDFYVSTDGTNWGKPVKAGSWPSSSNIQKEEFSVVSGRYIRLVPKSQRFQASQTNDPHKDDWVSAAEINVKGVASNATGFNNIRRMCIGVTPAAPDVVYLYAATNNASKLFKSTDAGQSFAEITVPSNMLTYKGQNNAGDYGWCMAFAVSTTNANHLLAGGINVWKATDDANKDWHLVDHGLAQIQVGGQYKKNPLWYHVDIQSLAVYGNKAWITSDGGVYCSDDLFTAASPTIHNKSDNIVAQEIWGFDQGWKSDIMAIGMFHGPIEIRDDSIYTNGWYAGSGADSTTAMVNKGDDQYIYAHPWGDKIIVRSNDKMRQPAMRDLGAGTPQVKPDLEYVFSIDVFNHSYYFTFYTLDDVSIKKTTDNAATWTLSKGFSNGKKPRRIATSYSDPDVAYAIVDHNALWKTADGGTSWTAITPLANVTHNKSLSNLTIDGKDPNIVWVCMGGKQTTVKVIKTTDGGQSWTDYSTPAGAATPKLPAYEINDIAHQLGTDGGVYIGTDAGVWYRSNKSQHGWQPYNTGLPKATRVDFIRLNYAKSKIRLGTSRGIWEFDLFEASSPIAQPMTATKVVTAGQAIKFVDHSVAKETDQQAAQHHWSFPGGTPCVSTAVDPQVTYNQPGIYDVTLVVTDADGNQAANTRKSFIAVVDASRTVLPVSVVADSEETVDVDGRAANAMDGNAGTYWMTKKHGGVAPLPHHIDLDLGNIFPVTGVKYAPPNLGNNATDGFVTSYEIYLSTDGANWGSAAKSGPLAADLTTKTINLPAPAKPARYVRFKVLTVSGNNIAWTTAAEISVVLQ